MAIAFDATSSGSSGGASSITFAHTCTGSNRVLFVTVIGEVIPSITGVTYAGVAMTQVGSSVSGGGSRSIHLFYLDNPASGANNVVVSSSPSGFMSAVSSSYTGFPWGYFRQFHH